MGKRVSVTRSQIDKVAREAFGKGAFVDLGHSGGVRRKYVVAHIYIPTESEDEARKAVLGMLEHYRDRDA